MSTARTSLFRLLCPALLLTLGLTLTFTLRPSRAVVAAAGKRQLSFDERVVYQRAIEDVYRRHRAATPQAKPALTTGITAAQSEAKVASYLRQSQALASVWQRPITGAQLQAELDRITQNTKKPALLRELYQALGNDPLVIAECLARPTLAEREIRASYARDVRLQGKERHEAFEQWWARAEERTGLTETMPTHSYRLQPVAAVAVACVNDTWRPTTLTGAPTARSRHTAVWTGAEMIVWGGSETNTGGRYNPATDSWTPTSLVGAPTERVGHTAVWTGSEMIIWGGSTNGLTNTGSRYNPATDTWTPTGLTGAPGARSQHSAVWTGSEMIVWGGDGPDFSLRNTGGRYNPTTDSWAPTSLTGAPATRHRHTAVWTGSEMIVWGGFARGGLAITNTGGRYNPATDTWTPTSLLGAAGRRLEHSAIWTGTEMIVWGGELNNVALNTGARYNPATDSWKGVTMTLPPTERDDYHAGVWTGTEMIVWGGDDLDGVNLNTGGRYNPATDSWTPTSTTSAPTGRDTFTAVWTGSEMIVWGGSINGLTNTGGAYCAQSGGAVNTPPTIVGTSLTRTAGSPAVNAQIAAISDAESVAGSLVVTVNGAASATVNNVTVSDLSINAAGQVTANVGAACTATNPSTSFTLRVTDGGGLFAEATLNVTVAANPLPTLGDYPNTLITPGGSAMITPSSAPADNVSISSVTVTAAGFTGTVTVNAATGVVSISSAGPAGGFTVSVTATDNCGAQATKTFTLTVMADTTPPTLTCPGNQTGVISGTSGPVTYPAPTVSDDQPGATFTCTPASGTNFALGVTTVNCTARDQAGNKAACSFMVTVRQPRPAIRDLINKVRQLAPTPLATAQANGLIGHLELANTSLERGQNSQACTHLQNFINQVNALGSGGPLTAAQGQSLTDYANKIKAAIGCGG